MQVGQSTSVVPFVDCLHPKINNSKSTMHAWELILKYYEIKNGDYFNSTPARKLSQSFNLDIEGCKSSVSYKQVITHMTILFMNLVPIYFIFYNQPFCFITVSTVYYWKYNNIPFSI